MAPMIDDDDSDDEVPLAVRAGVNKESGTPKARKPSASKKKKKKKKPVKGKAKGDSKPKVERKVYDLPGQKRDTPDETDSLRKFYLSLRVQKPESEMAETWLMEHGLLLEEEQKKAYRKMMAKKASGKSAPAKRPISAKPRSTPAKKVKSEPSKKKAKALVDDDDSDDDAPLASLKRAGDVGGFTIPKTEAK